MRRRAGASDAVVERPNPAKYAEKNTKIDARDMIKRHKILLKKHYVMGARGARCSVAREGAGLRGNRPGIVGVRGGVTTMRLTSIRKSRWYNGWSSGPAVQRSSGPAVQRSSGPKCVRRLAGAYRPTPSAGSPRRPEPRTGRSRVRLFRLLPALALLVGAISLLNAVPVQAQQTTSVWSAALTVDLLVGSGITNFGCSNTATGLDSGSAAPTNDDFQYGNAIYTVRAPDLAVQTGESVLSFEVTLTTTPLGRSTRHAGVGGATRAGTNAGAASVDPVSNPRRLSLRWSRYSELDDSPIAAA